MIVYCEECGFRNAIDAARIKNNEVRIICGKCGDPLRFYGMKAKAIKAALAPVTSLPRSCLILKYGGAVVVVSETNSRIEIGRRPSTDIQVANKRVSRIHAFIEFKKGKYFLTDQSSNGTYLLMEGRAGITVKQKEVMLTARGVIGPGYKVDFNSPHAIHMRFDQLL